MGVERQNNSPLGFVVPGSTKSLSFGVQRSIVKSIQGSVHRALRGRSCVLAVSGGLDSMVLLDAAASLDVALVATFDHGTGNAATEAARLVETEAHARGLRAETGRARGGLVTEAQWRTARWDFLRSVAQRENATIATAHTRDDHTETVLMRVLRGAGARGLAGLYADSPVIRPLLARSRHELVAYARMRRLRWVEDPSNASRHFLRNRVRHDLLPALRRAHPSIDAELLAIASRAEGWRRDMEQMVDSSIPYELHADDALDVGADALRPYPEASLAILWPVLTAKIGVVLDRRGTDRLARFAPAARVGSRIQLSGGWQVVRSRDRFQVRPSADCAPASRSIDQVRGLSWGPWSFRPGARDRANAWSAWLPVDQPLHVRVWSPGDTMIVRFGAPARKVKRLLSDAGVTGHERGRWPVVTAGDQIVWIPGVRRGQAAAERSGRPGLVFSCEYQHR